EGFVACFAGRRLTVAEVIEPTKPSMLDLDIQKKLEVLELAAKLQNVSEAARLSGVSRDTIYRHRKLVQEKGIQALKRQVRVDHCHGNRTDQAVADTVIEYSLDNPHLGQMQVANQLKKHYQIELSASGVRNVWLRENIQTCALRLQKQRSLRAANS
ncbi:MAG: helix-turn-helix domain-containing protein, partial [Pseudomonadota bacterium]